MNNEYEHAKYSITYRCLSLTCDTLRAVLATQITAPTSVWLLRLRLPWARQLLTAVSALAAASHTAG